MHPARLELCDGVIRHQVDGETVWTLHICDVRVIGEATNDHGPFLDDYALCFATDANSWYEASFYAEGREDFLKSLAAVLGCEIVLRLVGCTDFDSNVLWPPRLAGKPMFSFRPMPPTTWIGRLLGVWKNTQRFSSEVEAELQDAALSRMPRSGAV